MSAPAVFFLRYLWNAYTLTFVYFCDKQIISCVSPLSQANNLTQEILRYLFSRGAFGWRSNSVGIFDPVRRIYRTAPKKGVSDILACYKGKFIAIEVKIGKDRLSPEQEGFLKSIEYTGGITFIAKDLDSFVSFWRDTFGCG